MMDQRAAERHDVGSGPWRGFYINLDRSADRREALARQLAGAGLAGRYVRFPAVEGAKLQRSSPLTPGEIGCFASHLAVLEKAARGTEPVHVLEDDALLWTHLPSAFAEIRARGLLRDFDILFTETMVNPDLRAIKTLKENFDAATADPDAAAVVSRLGVMDLATVHFSCSSSYLVTPRGAEKIIALMRQEWAAGPALPYDFFLRREAHQGHLRIGCVFPFVTSVDLAVIARSTAGRIDAAGPTLILAALRYAFYLGHDLDGPVREYLTGLDRGADKDPQRELLSQILGLIISDRFHIF